MSKKKRVAKVVGASALATATIVSGLSFGPLAANAAPANTVAGIQSERGALIFGSGNLWSAMYPGDTPSGVDKTRFSSKAEAIAAAIKNDWVHWSTPVAGGGPAHLMWNDKCFRGGFSAEFQPYSTTDIMYVKDLTGSLNTANCGLADQTIARPVRNQTVTSLFTLKNGLLVGNGGYGWETQSVTQTDNTQWFAPWNAKGQEIPGLAHINRSAPSGDYGDGVTPVAPIVGNGGLAAAALGFPVSVAAGETADAFFGVQADAAISSMTGTTMTLTAPAGTHFAAGTTSVSGQWRDSASDAWADAANLAAKAEVSEDGKTMTVTFDSSSDFGMKDGGQLRWAAPIVGDTAGVGNMGIDIAGTTNEGAFTAKGSSEITVTAPEIANGGFSADALGWPVTIEQGKSADVFFGLQATAKVTDIDGTYTVTAPEGTHFAKDPGELTTEYRTGDGADWQTSATAKATGTVSDDGTTLTVKVTAGGSFSLPADAQIRWSAPIVGDTVGSGAAALEMTGTTNNGTFTATGSSEVTVTAKPVDPVTNGGFSADALGWPATVEQGGSTDVFFGLQSTAKVTKIDGTTYTVTAPKGTHFAADPGKLSTEYKAVTDSAWKTSSTASAQASVSEDGSTLTVTISAGGSFSIPADTQLRWHAPLVGDTAGTGDASLAVSGTTNHGAFTASGVAPITVTAASKPAALTNLEGYFTDNVRDWAHIKGTGAVSGATITVKSGDKTIASGAAKSDGTFDLQIDPAKVGYGNIAFQVTQTVAGKGESDPASVNLDYGQNTPTFTSPTNGDTISSTGQTFTGTGTTGAELKVSGVGGAGSLGSGTVVDGKWSFTNTDVQLPAGTYQVWANQFTKGGKFASTGINVTVAASKPAPLTNLTGYFTGNVRDWAHITGTGAVKGATVTVKSGGKTIASGAAKSDGTFDFQIDPAKVGYGTVAFEVTQTVAGSPESDPASTTLDYGQNTPTFTSPTNGATISDTGQTFTGTGTTGAELKVSGVGGVGSLGSGTVVDGKWSFTNTDVQLPAGTYQVWANQFTKGGKFASAGVNVTVKAGYMPALTGVSGYFTDNIRDWAHITGSGAAKGATVTVKSGDTVIASGVAKSDGTFDFQVDPAKVGYGTVAFQVTQTLGKNTSAPVSTSLDYGQNAPTFTSPTNGATVPTTGQTFTGTGTTGGQLWLSGTDLTTSHKFGDVTVTDGKWSFQNTEVTLPAGVYQMWANQFTKGGKFASTGVNMIVQ